MVDAAILYMIATLASGELRMVMHYPTATNRECQNAASFMAHGKIANAYRRAGARDVWVYCAPWPKPVVTDKVPPAAG